MELSAYSLGIRRGRLEHIAEIVTEALVEMDRFTKVRKQYMENFEDDFLKGMEQGKRSARIDYPVEDGARVCKDAALHDNAIVFTVPLEMSLDAQLDAEGIGHDGASVIHGTNSEGHGSQSFGGGCTSTSAHRRDDDVSDPALLWKSTCECVEGKPLKRIKRKSTPVSTEAVAAASSEA